LEDKGDMSRRFKENGSFSMGEEPIRSQMRAACERAARVMGVSFDDAGIDLLIEYAEELRHWNKAYNLVGRNIGSEGIVKLFVDALTPLYIKGLLDGEKEVVDIGSGAGLPGIPLYIAQGPFPLTLVESQRKKVTFIRHICRKFGLKDARTYPGRLESMSREEDSLNAFEVGLARAAMEPLRLLSLARPLLCEGGRLVLFVGKNDGSRIKKASLDLQAKGMIVEAIRSTQRLVGKENFLAVIRKASA
jgi:16S rRNA (guanine527-N7)-methyltransferase